MFRQTTVDISSAYLTLYAYLVKQIKQNVVKNNTKHNATQRCVLNEHFIVLLVNIIKNITKLILTPIIYIFFEIHLIELHVSGLLFVYKLI